MITYALAELNFTAGQLYNELQDGYQQRSGSKLTGYEYTPFNSTQGNTVLTSYLLNVLARFTFLEANMTSPNSTY